MVSWFEIDIGLKLVRSCIFGVGTGESPPVKFEPALYELDAPLGADPTPIAAEIGPAVGDMLPTEGPEPPEVPEPGATPEPPAVGVAPGIGFCFLTRFCARFGLNCPPDCCAGFGIVASTMAETLKRAATLARSRRVKNLDAELLSSNGVARAGGAPLEYQLELRHLRCVDRRRGGVGRNWRRRC